MTTQVLELINDAYALIGEYDTSAPLSSADTQLGFRALNRMIDSWSNDKSTIFEYLHAYLPLVAGLDEYSLDTVQSGYVIRKIEAQNIVDNNNVTSPLEQISVDRWSTITMDSTPGMPYWMCVLPQAEHTDIRLYPVPYGGLRLQLWYWAPIQRFANTSSIVELPQGYEDALIYNLAIRVAPMFERTVSPEVTAIAARALAAIESTNLPHTELSVAMVPTASRGGGFNWRSGEVE